MKNSYSFLKTGLLTLVAFGAGLSAYATTYTAITSGNFSNPSIWRDGVTPPVSITGTDNISIPTGLVINLDQNVSLNNALASFSLNGILSGTGSVSILSGAFRGTGNLAAHNLTYGAGAGVTFSGITVVDNLYSSATSISLAGNISVADTLGIYSGTAQLASGATLTLDSNSVINVSNGNYSSAGGGTLALAGNINLLYTGTGTMRTGSELALSRISNVTVNLTSAADQLQLNADLAVNGILNVQRGILHLNGRRLTINNVIRTSATGLLGGNASSSMVLAGASDMGTLAFTPALSTVGTLQISGLAGSFVTLTSDLTITGTLTMMTGNMHLSGASDLIVSGTDSIHGGSATSYIATAGSGSLKVAIGPASASRFFPIGTSSTYAPVRVTNSSATAGTFSADAHAGIFANGTSGADLSLIQSSVNTSWNIESDITSGASATLEAFWPASAEVNVFNRANVQLSHYTAGAWDMSGNSAAIAQANGMASARRTGITSFSPFAVFSDRATGVSDITAIEAFSTYPNPALNTITVSLPSAKADNAIKIFDLIGNKVADYTVHNTSNTIDISALNAGVYLLSVNNSTTQKFVKQ